MARLKIFHDSKRLGALAFVALFFLMLSAVSWGALVSTNGEKYLSVSFLDVGQGDAIFIETPLGSQVLIDGGRGSDVLRELSTVMPFWDRSIDIIVATHPDADHIGGLVEVFERFDVEYIVETDVENDTPVYRAYREVIRRRGPERIVPARGTQIEIDETATLTILSREVVAASDTNDASIVMRLDYGETSFLFTGDATKFVEEELLEFHELLDTDVLKVGHHGSSTSTSAAFVSAVSPDIAVISVGADNSYGHPTSEVLTTLENAGAVIYRTDEDGTIRLISDGMHIQKKSVGILGKTLGL